MSVADLSAALLLYRQPYRREPRGVRPGREWLADSNPRCPTRPWRICATLQRLLKYIMVHTVPFVHLVHILGGAQLCIRYCTCFVTHQWREECRNLGVHRAYSVFNLGCDPLSVLQILVLLYRNFRPISHQTEMIFSVLRFGCSKYSSTGASSRKSKNSTV